MGRLSQEEKELFKRKKKLVVKRMEPMNRHSIIIRSIVRNNLIKLVKSNNTGFVCDMYVDFLEHQIVTAAFRSMFMEDDTRNIYKLGFTPGKDDEDSLFRSFQFCKYMYSMFEKVYGGYDQKYSRGSDYYIKNWQNEDNKCVFELRDYTVSLMSKKDDDYNHFYNRALLKLMSYILLHEELLFNKEEYEKLLSSLSSQFSIVYDDYLINHGCVDLEDFFNPVEYVEQYRNGFNTNKKEIL